MRKIFILIIFSSVNLFAQNQQPLLGTLLDWSKSINHGLILFLPTWERSGLRTYDISGDGLVGVFDGSETWTAGLNGWAIDIDGGSTQHFDISDFNHNVGTGAFTITSWVWLDANSGTSGWAGMGAATPGFLTNTNASEWGFFWSTFFSTGISLNLSEWNFLIITRDNNTNMKCYRNGVLEGETTRSDNMPNGTFRFGSRTTGDAGDMDGRIENIRFYNRELSQRDVDLLYRQPYAGFVDRLILAAAVAAAAVEKRRVIITNHE